MKSSYLAAGVIGLALGGLWYAGGGSRPSAASAAEQSRVSGPVTHENLAVFLVYGPDTVDDSRVVTLQEALDHKWAVVHETGQVNELAVENLSPEYELFVQSGDMIKGGRQDRVIASDLLVPPAAGRVPVRVHCVEAGRWTGRPNDEEARFGTSNSFAVGNNVKLANAHLSQTEVWENVKVNQDKLTKTVGMPVNDPLSPTSLQLALENSAVRAKAEAYQQALASACEERGVVGAVFVVNGKVTSAEVYGSNGLFRKAWPKLLKAASEEALAEKTERQTAHLPTARAVERFLASAEQADGPTRKNQTATGRAIQRRGANEPAAADLTNDDPGLEVGLNAALPELERITVSPDHNQPQQNAVTPERMTTARTRDQRMNTTPSTLIPFPARPGSDGATTMNRRVQTVDQTPDQLTFARSPLNVAEQIWGTSATNQTGNRLNTRCAENASTLMLEARDPARNAVVHRSYIKK